MGVSNFLAPAACVQRSGALFPHDEHERKSRACDTLRMPKKQARDQAPPATAPPESPAWGRGKSGQWPPGRSGNPAGRPSGSRNRVSEIAATMIAGDVEAVMLRLLTMAKTGDRVALRLVVDRVLPRAAANRHVSAELPRLRCATDIAEAMAQIIGLVASGDMSLEEARQFAALLELQRAAIESSDLQVRLEALEGQGERE